MPKPTLATLLFAYAALAGAQQNVPGTSELTRTPEPLRAGITEDRLFSELLAQNGHRSEGLIAYVAQRTYEVRDPKGKVHAEEVGRMEYEAPDKKTFTVTSVKGSGVVRRLALKPLIDSEIWAAAGKEHHD